MDEITTAAFFDELQNIQKVAGIGSAIGGFLKGGLRSAGELATKAGRSGLLAETKALPKALKSSWKQGGWRQAGKTMAGSRPVQLAGVASIPFMAGRMTSGD